jgi:fatty acid desaturase
MSLPRGYDPPSDFHETLKIASSTNLFRTVLVAILDHALVLLCGLAALTSLRTLGPWGVFLYLPLVLIAARQMRGLECLVHEASHYNWTRNHSLNDNLANLFAAWPVLSKVENYRITHLIHHQSLGTENDTDWVRWQKLRLDQLDRSTSLGLMVGLIKRLAPYVPGWWWAIGVDIGTVVRFLAWHLIFLLFPLVLIAGPLEGFLIWLVSWPIPLFIVLPVLRFIGEIEEHDYNNRETVFDATYTNTGTFQKFLLHPHGDAYHTFHHLFPSVPHFRIRHVHALLYVQDSAVWANQLKERKGVLVR